MWSKSAGLTTSIAIEVGHFVMGMHHQLANRARLVSPCRMPMIPLTFMIALPLLVLVFWMIIRFGEPMRAPWLIGFLLLLAFQLVIIGTRYGFGVDAIILIQPLSGILVAPAAYLAFANPRRPAAAVKHLVVLPVMLLVIELAPSAIDAVLAAVTFAYASLLCVLGWRSGETLAWAPFRYGRALRFALWSTVLVLLMSGMTDLLVSADVQRTGGLNIASIAAAATLLGTAASLAGVVAWLTLFRTKTGVADSSADEATMKLVNATLDRDDLFRDPDLTLNRLSRRSGLPARQISEAINRTTGSNVSQFVNGRRIAAVCDLLQNTDCSITQTMFEAGFYTKSNFNREFKRVTGLSPSAWRSANPAAKSGESEG